MPAPNRAPAGCRLVAGWPTLAWAAALAASAATSACKDTTHKSDNEVATVIAKKSPNAAFYAAGTVELQRTSDFYLKVWNQTFTSRFDDLPTAGELPNEKKPMTGSFYPQRDHGTNKVMVGNQSPLQKYDQAFNNGGNSSSAWEEKNHTSDVSWAGHCNGFAASGQRHPREPKKTVTRGNVSFAPQDIKALMAELYMNADFQFLGGERCLEETPNLAPDSRSDATVMSACQGLNPATLHAALGNWVGKMQHAIIMDRYAGIQVWNHPVVKFQVASSNAVTAQQAAQAVDGQDSYKFNPNAVKFLQVHTYVYSVNTTATEVLGQLNLATDDLTYILELNANGELVGGEWTGNSITQHPNFLWVAFEPLPSNGSAALGNPYLDAGKVLSLWADSVDDPKNPPPDISRPVDGQSWGKLSAFTAVLDGFSSGAAFAGKSLQLQVSRGPALAGAGVELDLAMNGAPLTSVTSTGDEIFNIPITASSGMNRFQFTWKKNGAVVDDEYLRFRLSR